MAQVTSGLRKALSIPLVYDTLQYIFGSDDFSKWLVKEFIKNENGSNRILDVGCGTANILAYLDDVEYFGFDPSSKYIETARKKFGKKGTFECSFVSEDILENQEPFDTIIALGVLHHLDDDDVEKLAALIEIGLKDGGRFIALEPCYVAGQNWISKLLIDMDRGQNVRTEPEYIKLFSDRFNKISTTIHHKSWIPYTYCITVVEK